MGGTNWIREAQVRNHWLALLKVAMKLWVLQKVENPLTEQARFSGKGWFLSS